MSGAESNAISGILASPWRLHIKDVVHIFFFPETPFTNIFCCCCCFSSVFVFVVVVVFKFPSLFLHGPCFTSTYFMDGPLSTKTYLTHSFLSYVTLKVALAVLTFLTSFSMILTSLKVITTRCLSTLMIRQLLLLYGGGRLLRSVSVTVFRLDEYKWNVLQPKQT